MIATDTTAARPQAAALSIREVAARTGITAHTLRYYERIGLVPRVGRANSGHRRYGEADVRWLEFLKKLQATEMPIRKMLEYARLVRRGDASAAAAARRALLDAHRGDVEDRIARLASSLAVIKRKIAMYDAPAPRRTTRSSSSKVSSARVR